MWLIDINKPTDTVIQYMIKATVTIKLATVDLSTNVYSFTANKTGKDNAQCNNSHFQTKVRDIQGTESKRQQRMHDAQVYSATFSDCLLWQSLTQHSTGGGVVQWLAALA